LTRTPGTQAKPKRQQDVDEFAIAASHQSIKRGMCRTTWSERLSFLVSDDAAFVTGQTIYVDGGHVRT